MQVVLYSRPGCHLCDEARAVLVAARESTPFELDEVDIESSDALIREFGLRIPVVTMQGRVEFECSVDRRAFEALLDS